MPFSCRFEQLLEKGPDSALLLFSLGNAYLNEKAFAQAVVHLRQAVTLNPDYTAAWKLYGKALTATGELAEAVEAYERGISVANLRGDIQAAKEMGVFLRRLQQGAG